MQFSSVSDLRAVQLNSVFGQHVQSDLRAAQLGVWAASAVRSIGSSTRCLGRRLSPICGQLISVFWPQAQSDLWAAQLGGQPRLALSALGAAGNSIA